MILIIYLFLNDILIILSKNVILKECDCNFKQIFKLGLYFEHIIDIFKEVPS